MATKKTKTVVIDAKWHTERVARCQHWIEFSKQQIAWYEQGLAKEKEHLTKAEQWLTEALHDQEEFLKRK